LYVRTFRIEIQIKPRHHRGLAIVQWVPKWSKRIEWIRPMRRCVLRRNLSLFRRAKQASKQTLDRWIWNLVCLRKFDDRATSLYLEFINFVPTILSRETPVDDTRKTKTSTHAHACANVLCLCTVVTWLQYCTIKYSRCRNYRRVPTYWSLSTVEESVGKHPVGTSSNRHTPQSI
jgi:hypothetical protein